MSILLRQSYRDSYKDNPKDFVKKGQEIELKVIRLDPADKRINLSLKHFTEDPWLHFEDKYNVNDIVKGKVTKLTEFGAFIELEEGIEGLLKHYGAPVSDENKHKYKLCKAEFFSEEHTRHGWYYH